MPPYLITWKDWKINIKFKLIKWIELGIKAKAMPRTMMVLWEHMFHESYSFIFIRPVPLPPLMFIFHISYFCFFLKNIYNFLLEKNIYSILIVLCCRLDCKFSIYWIKGMKRGAAWATLDGVLSKLWVTDAQKNFGLILVIITSPHEKWTMYIFLYQAFLQMALHRRYFLIASEKLLF